MPKRIGFNDAQADWRRAGRDSAPGDIEHGVPAPDVVRWAVIGFLALWLVGWTSGIVFAFIALFGIAADNVPLSSFLIHLVDFRRVRLGVRSTRHLEAAAGAAIAEV